MSIQHRRQPVRAARYLAGALLLAAGILLAGCSPRFNWRQFQDDSASYSVLMPAKPASMDRSLQLAGLQLSMAMSAAEAGQHNFAVGHIRLSDAGQAGLVMQAMRQGLLANLRSRPEQIHTLSDGSVQADGVSPGGLPLRLQARFVISGTDVYQIVVLAPLTVFNEEQSNMFLSSFRTAAMQSATP